LGGKSIGWVPALQVASNVNWYWADGIAVSVGTIGAAGGVGVAAVSVGAIIVAGGVGVAAGSDVDVSVTVEVGIDAVAGVVDGMTQPLITTRMSDATRMVPGAICKVK